MKRDSKFYKGLERADGGNENLCQKCLYGQIRSGTNKEVDIICNKNGPFGGKLSFVVTSCSEYVNVHDIGEYDVPSDFKKIALYLDRREKIGKEAQANPDCYKFVTAEEAVESKLIDRYYLEG